MCFDIIDSCFVHKPPFNHSHPRSPYPSSSFFLDLFMPIISHAHPQLRQPSPHSPIIIPTTFSLSSSTPHVNAPSSLGRGSGSGVFLLQHSGEPHALRTLRNADAVHFNRSLVVHRHRVRIFHMARLLWELRGDDVEDAVST